MFAFTESANRRIAVGGVVEPMPSEFGGIAHGPVGGHSGGNHAVTAGSGVRIGQRGDTSDASSPFFSKYALNDS